MVRMIVARTEVGGVTWCCVKLYGKEFWFFLIKSKILGRPSLVSVVVSFF